MKKKELMKRMSAFAMSAMMTVTMIPSNAFAADIDFTDGGQEAIEVQADEEDDAEISIQDEDTDGAEVLTGEDLSAEDSDTDVFSAEGEADAFSAESEDIAVFADDETADGSTDDAKAAAAEYLKTNYVDNNKIITSGGTGVVKSEDGLSYSVGLKMPSGSSISSIRLKTEGSSSSYKAGWYISSDCQWLNVSTKKPASMGSIGINRPSADQGAQEVKAVLRLFSSDTTTDVINDASQAATAALAEQEFTITIEAAEPVYTMTVKVQDEEGNAIDDATITLEKSWSTVSPKEDGSYEMEKGAQYTLTVKKDGYNDYKESYFTFNPTETNTIKTVTLKKIVIRNIRFNVTDKSGNPIDGATVTVKQGYYTTINPESDGSYKLIDGTAYKYTVEAKNYKTISNKDFTPDKDGTIDVQLEKDISEYTVSIKPVDSDGNVIENASIKVTYEEEDDWDDTTETVELKANEDGTYTMQKGVEYTYTVTAPDYREATGTYTASGDDENVTVKVTMVTSIDQADVDTVNAIKAKFDKEGPMRPEYANYKNIIDFVNDKIAGYTDIDTTGVTVSVKSTGDSDVIAADGTIHYRAEAPNQYGMNFSNVSVVYIFEKNGAKAESDSSTAQICWDADYFNTQMAAEKDSLTWDNIKGNNTDAEEVTSDLTLPRCMTGSLRTAWSTIAWTSSDESVISFKKPEIDSDIYPLQGVINAQPEDTEVTLTATFSANDSLLNTNVEKVSDFTTLTKEFKVTVKGTGVLKPTEEELQAILDKYYTEDRIKIYNEDQVADLKNCTYDLQLPRYTRIKDENGEDVFANREIAVTTDNDAITVNGYRAAVDRFAGNEDIIVNLIVTFTRDDITVSKKIPVTVKPVTEAEVQDQLDLMDYAKAHYFDGINDGRYADKDSITGDLHAFQELTAEKTWVYNYNDRTGKGIVPDDLPDSDEMGTSGFRLFKSSNSAVVAHENLVVTRRETDTQITISSVLSSELYKDAAEKHPDNALLQKLYKQPVSVTVTIKGTRPATEGLQKLIDEAQTLLDGMTEGTEAGQYPEGTKSTLQEAIDAAKEVLNKENLTEKEVNDAIQALQTASETAKDTQNPYVAAVTVRVNLVDQPTQVSAVTVTSKDAAAYGYVKPDAMRNQVTAADALYTLHKAMYGDAFDANPSDYLVIDNAGSISKIFGIETMNLGYYVNNAYPVDENGTGTMANNTVLKDGDEFSVYLIADTTGYSDEYMYFEDVPKTIYAGKEFAVAVKGTSMLAAGVKNEADCTVELKNLDTAETAEFVTDENGVATIKADKAGKYQLTVTKTPYQYYVAPLAQLEAEEHVFDEGKVTKEATCGVDGEKTYTCTVCGATKTEVIEKTGDHQYNDGEVTKEPTCAEEGEKIYTCTVCHETRTESIAKTDDHKFVWKTISEATALAPEKQQGTCDICGATTTRDNGEKLAATIKLNVTSIELQQKQSTNKIKVTAMTKGDYVKSWESNNQKIATVSKSGVIKAGKKNGTARITVTLASGKKATVTVKVQKAKVATTKISGLKSKETLKKGKKLTLKPVISPITSLEKVTYTSSNKKVATVSKKGVITAKKKGTAKITVKSGKKTFTVKVTVK